MFPVPKRKNLIGQRFGLLTVVALTDQIENNYVVWRCKCDCGGEILVNTKHLMRHTITNCGCIPKTNAKRGSIAEDLTGQVFGDLTVLHRTESLKGRTRWVCQCSCGNQTIVTTRSLKEGKVKSCGCKQHSFPHNVADISGQRFGRLVAQYPTSNRSKKGSVLWHCRCDCGNELEVSEDGLVHGHFRSCGCLKREIQQNIKNQLHLVDGTCVEWLEKRKSRSDNTSGFRGVYLTKTGNYRVGIGFKRKRYYVGTYDSFELAVQARLQAEEIIHHAFLQVYYQWQEQVQQDPEWAKTHPLLFEVSKENGVFVVKTQSENFDECVKRKSSEKATIETYLCTSVL